MVEPLRRAIAPQQARRLAALLAAIAEHDRAIERRTYERFLADEQVRMLFGTSEATRRTMFDDTLTSLYDLCEGSPWLRENLLAFGSRHRHTYEVRIPMYAAWRDALVGASVEVLGAALDADDQAALAEGLDVVHETMLDGAYPKGRPGPSVPVSPGTAIGPAQGPKRGE